jgi:hypothetical protein
MADVESRAWVQRLSFDGAVRDEALKDLHELLLRAARFEVARRRVASPPGTSLPLEPELWALIADDDLTAHQKTETTELFGALQHAIRHDLTAHQREVLDLLARSRGGWQPRR